MMVGVPPARAAQCQKDVCQDTSTTGGILLAQFSGSSSEVFKNFVHETTGKKPDRDLAIETGTRLLSEGKPVDELLIASLLDTGRYKRRAARSAVRYLSRHFAHQVKILNNGGMPVLVPRCEA